MKSVDVLDAGFRSEPLEVPGWPEPVVIRQLGALDAIRWKATLTVDVRSLADTKPELVPAAVQPGDDLRKAAHLVVLCTLNQAGERLFDESEIDRVANLPDPIIALLTKAATRVNGLDPEAIARAEADFDKAPS